MSHRQRSEKRQTIRIKLPPKPAAPRHPQAIGREFPAPEAAALQERKHSPFLFPLVQVGIASMLSMMVLDYGECSHIVVFAALGYVGGLLMMVPRREALTPDDELFVRWGFVMLCLVSCLLAPLVWALRGHAL